MQIRIQLTKVNANPDPQNWFVQIRIEKLQNFVQDCLRELDGAENANKLENNLTKTNWKCYNCSTTTCPRHLVKFCHNCCEHIINVVMIFFFSISLDCCLKQI
jgi:hypothetical protein